MRRRRPVLGERFAETNRAPAVGYIICVPIYEEVHDSNLQDCGSLCW
jgi:hypothetical protein